MQYKTRADQEIIYKTAINKHKKAKRYSPYTIRITAYILAI